MQETRQGAMGQALQARLTALEIVKAALNYARLELQRQLVTGTVNPQVTQGRVAASQGGHAPTKIDARVNDFIEDRVHRAMPGTKYLSEEIERNIDLDDGQLVAWCDPVDGTANAFTALGGYAVVLWLDEHRGGRLDHLGGAIGTAHGEVVSWQHVSGVGEVWVDFPYELRWPGDPLQGADDPDRQRGLSIANSVRLGTRAERKIYPGLQRRLSAVASSNERRKLLLRAFDFDRDESHLDRRDQLWLNTLGGNPAVVPLLLGDLAANIEPKSVKLIDCAYLIPLVLSGGVVVDLDDRGNIEIFNAFAQLEPSRRKLGPFIAAASEEAVAELVSRRK